MQNKIEINKKERRKLFKEAMFGAFKESSFRFLFIFLFGIFSFKSFPFKNFSLFTSIGYSSLLVISIMFIIIISSWFYMQHLFKNNKEIEIKK